MTETTPAMAHLCLLFFSPGITGSSSECVLFPACWNNFIYMCVCGGGGVQLLQSCPTLCDPMDCSPPGSSIHGIFQARILEWMAISSSRGSSLPRNQIHVFCVSWIGRWILYHWATWDSDVAKFSKCSLFFLPHRHELTSCIESSSGIKYLLGQYLLTDSQGTRSTIFNSRLSSLRLSAHHLVQPQVNHNSVGLPLHLAVFLFKKKVCLIKFIFLMRRSLLPWATINQPVL